MYIAALQSEGARQQFRTSFFPLLPATVLSTVVAYELSVCASDVRTRDLLAAFIDPMERAGRVVSPFFADWQLAAQVVSSIARKDGAFKSKLPSLQNDILIALSARRSGAELITRNGADFRLIAKHVDFQLRVVA